MCQFGKWATVKLIYPFISQLHHLKDQETHRDILCLSLFPIGLQLIHLHVTMNSLWVTYLVYFESQTSPLSPSFKAFPVRGSSNFTSAARWWWVLNTWWSENGWSGSGFLRFWTKSLDIFGILWKEAAAKCEQWETRGLVNYHYLIYSDMIWW